MEQRGASWAMLGTGDTWLGGAGRGGAGVWGGQGFIFTGSEEWLYGFVYMYGTSYFLFIFGSFIYFTAIFIFFITPSFSYIDILFSTSFLYVFFLIPK